MPDPIYFIGDINEIESSTYLTNNKSIFINLNYLIATYYPLLYENITKFYSSFNNDAVIHDDINLKKVNIYISTLNNKDRIYNTNNTYILTLMVILLWAMVLFFILRFIYIQFPTFYSYTILIILIAILIIASVWSIYSMMQNI